MTLCCASLSHKLLCINNFVCYTCQMAYVQINQDSSSLNEQETYDGLLRSCSWYIKVRDRQG